MLAGGAAAQAPGAAAAAAPAAAGPAGAAAATADPTVHTGGRVVPTADGLAFGWPGVYFEGRFRGTGVGVVFDDAVGDYDVILDGHLVATWVTPGTGTRWLQGLGDGEHTIRVVRRNESPWTTTTFGGFVAAPGGAVLPARAPRRVQLEFFGDSYTAGYGNESPTRECTGDEVARRTNADRSFAALTAQALGADYQLNAFSGRGMVRNYAGGEPGTSFRTYADRALPAVDGDVWDRPAGWHPQVVVVGLGINDFSTPVGAGEPWTAATLRTAYRAAYEEFVAQLRERYGPTTFIVLGAPDTAPEVRDITREIAFAAEAAGDDRVVPWLYGGLDLTGCHWHPSLSDHQVVAVRLTELVTSLLRVEGIEPSPDVTPPGPPPQPSPTGPTGYPIPSPTGPTGSPVPTSSATPTPTRTPGFPAATCTATLTVAGRWPGGYQASVTVTAGTRAVGGWRATFDLPSGGAVQQGWSGDFSTSGATVTVRNAAWNGRLDTGGTTTAGFIGTGTPPTGTVACSAV
ncbi:cellulose-binding protein [Cellulomonas shaoxiangyii]|uniref:Cellulose-binding protein n=3 Tax=Cellulomonas shaoxiangyii TaxID=2566013 RepID=A0A4P7SLP3_9CELL|nr:cellulose-binding protein [Cellulomonas shaoxiangyii]